MDTVRSVIVITLNGVIEMPNIFSPNGDGHNDRFLPLDLTGVTGRLEIFNRWGQMIHAQQRWSKAGMAKWMVVMHRMAPTTTSLHPPMRRTKHGQGT